MGQDVRTLLYVTGSDETFIGGAMAQILGLQAEKAHLSTKVNHVLLQDLPQQSLDPSIDVIAAYIPESSGTGELIEMVRASTQALLIVIYGGEGAPASAQLDKNIFVVHVGESAPALKMALGVDAVTAK